MSEIMSEIMSGSFSPSECETVSTNPSRSPTPDACEISFMSAVTMSKLDGTDRFYFGYMQPSRSTRFWFEDGSMTIKVENTLYSVHGSVLRRQSNFFRLPIVSDWYSHTPRVPTSSAGSLLEPLILDVVKSDFEFLLTLIYPSGFLSRYNFTVQEWFRIAKVATTLEFTFIRKAALENIFDRCSSALELINLGRKHSIPECLSSGFRMLCFADEPLSFKEGQSIGMALVIQIAYAREMLAKGTNWSELESKFAF